MLPRSLLRKSVKTGILLVSVLSLLLSGILVQAQDDPQKRYLTWADAPVTQPIRHTGDAQVHWGWETTEKAYGPFTEHPFEVGERTDFLISGESGYEFELFYRSEHAYFWFEVGQHVNMKALTEAAARFDTDVWRLDRYLYGENLSPGIDGDERIHIVHLEQLSPGLAGFFDPDDQCAQSLCTASNQRDTLYMILDYGPLNSDRYFSTLAHEFQHMIQFTVDGNEYRWLDEGFSQLAEHLNGFSEDPINSDNVSAYLGDPNLRLDSWSLDYGEQSGYYGAGYLMMIYLYERFGVEFVRELARNPLDGLASIHDVLQRTNQGVGINEVVLDWWIANLVDNAYAGDGRYYYQTFNLDRDFLRVEPLTIGGQEMVYRGLINQYGVAYFDVNEPGQYSLTFEGDYETPLALIKPHSGQWAWWSYNASGSATSLTRTVDLTRVDRATLKYWFSGETGRFPGYLHLLISTDGSHWGLLRGTNMELGDFYSDAPGPHYSGRFTDWQADFIDLSNYAGQSVQIRFEYVTNNAIAGPGFMLDDISIPEIGWFDDMETVSAGWTADGFLRTQEMVRQDWGLALVTEESIPQVSTISVENGQASATIEIPSGGAVIVIGAMAPFTPIEAGYTLRLKP